MLYIKNVGITARGIDLDLVRRNGCALVTVITNGNLGFRIYIGLVDDRLRGEFVILISPCRTRFFCEARFVIQFIVLVPQGQGDGIDPHVGGLGWGEPHGPIRRTVDLGLLHYLPVLHIRRRHSFMVGIGGLRAVLIVHIENDVV